MFDTPSIKRSPVLVLLKRVCFVLLSVYLVIGLIAAYRAWFQVKSLDLKLTGIAGVFRPNDPARQPVVSVGDGSTIEATIVSYARTPVDVRLELIQGAHAETVASLNVPDNDWAFFDPRTRRASVSTRLSEEVLNRFEPGRAGAARDCDRPSAMDALATADSLRTFDRSSSSDNQTNSITVYRSSSFGL